MAEYLCRIPTLNCGKDFPMIPIRVGGIRALVHHDIAEGYLSDPDDLARYKIADRIVLATMKDGDVELSCVEPCPNPACNYKRRQTCNLSEHDSGGKPNTFFEINEPEGTCIAPFITAFLANLIALLPDDATLKHTNIIPSIPPPNASLLPIQTIVKARNRAMKSFEGVYTILEVVQAVQYITDIALGIE